MRVRTLEELEAIRLFVEDEPFRWGLELAIQAGHEPMYVGDGLFRDDTDQIKLSVSATRYDTFYNPSLQRVSFFVEAYRDEDNHYRLTQESVDLGWCQGNGVYIQCRPRLIGEGSHPTKVAYEQDTIYVWSDYMHVKTDEKQMNRQAFETLMCTGSGALAVADAGASMRATPGADEMFSFFGS